MESAQPALRLGVLGAAKISRGALYAPIAEPVDGVALVAIAARSRDRAQAHADEHNIAQVFDSYEAMLASPDIDAVYNPLPISLHHRYTLEALAAGKHVLCEKPFASNQAEAEEMVAAAEAAGLVLMEAFHWRFHPMADLIRRRVAELGAIQSIRAEFSVPISPEDDVRQSYELSGGALMDLGCYAVQWARFAADSEPTIQSATMVQGRPNVDITTTIEMEFPGDGAAIPCTIVTDMSQEADRNAVLVVEGADATMTVLNPIAPQHGNQVTIERGTETTTEEVGLRPTYSYQLEAFRDAVAGTGPCLTGGADAIATMAVIDAAYEAAGLPLRGQ